MPADNNKKGKTDSYCVALSGILSALSVVLMFSTGIIPASGMILPAVCGVLIWVIYREINIKWALLCYTAVTLLNILITPDIESKLLFTFFFGYYPIIRDLLMKIKNKIICYITRLLVFNIPCISVYLLLIFVFGMGELLEEFQEFGQFSVLAIWLLGNFTFVCYDYLLAQLPLFYDKIVRKKISRMLR